LNKQNYRQVLGIQAMLEIDVLDAEKQFDDLVERVERGEEIVITRNGEAVARLIPIATKTGAPVMGYSEDE
jgi:prevent-host-death family protein